MITLVRYSPRHFGGRPKAKIPLAGTHACNPHGRSHTFCGHLIVIVEGWSIEEETERIARIGCPECRREATRREA